MNQTRQHRGTTAFIAVALLLGAAALVASALSPRPKRFEAVAGRPLLEQDGKSFADAQVGLKFTPPEWGMQVRSTEASTHRAERLLVKYKRMLPDSAAAWLRVRVIDVPEEHSPADYLKNRKPPEADFKVDGGIEQNLSVGGHPAARLLYAGEYDDGRGAKKYQSEVVAIRRGGQIVEFAGTFASSDANAREQLRKTLGSVELER